MALGCQRQCFFLRDHGSAAFARSDIATIRCYVGQKVNSINDLASRRSKGYGDSVRCYAAILSPYIRLGPHSRGAYGRDCHVYKCRNLETPHRRRQVANYDDAFKQQIEEYKELGHEYRYRDQLMVQEFSLSMVAVGILLCMP